jgi:hypothetical protein
VVPYVACLSVREQLASANDIPELRHWLLWIVSAASVKVAVEYAAVMHVRNKLAWSVEQYLRIAVSTQENQRVRNRLESRGDPRFECLSDLGIMVIYQGAIFVRIMRFLGL